MNCLVLLSCVAAAIAAPGVFYHQPGYHGPQAIPHVLPSGHLADTHEVAAAKAEHYASIQKAAAHGGYAGSYSHGGGALDGAAASHDTHGDFRYHGPIAVPHVLHDGHIADTHEVAAAKAEHFAAVAKAKAHSGGHGHSGYHGGDDSRYAGGYDAGQSGFTGAYHGGEGYVGAYHGPLAKPVVLPNGFLADTHEVAAAKGQHFHALAEASHHSGASHYHH